jgi:phosphoglycolate phosphatase
MKKTLLIFDFDGTIADTPAVAVHIYNEMSGNFGLPTITRQEMMVYKNKSVSELMKLAKLSWLRLPSVVRQARSGFKKYLHEVEPIKGMPETLQQLQAAGYRMGILTSNSQENVEAFLKHNHVADFEFIHAPRSLFGKAGMIRKILRRERLAAGEVLMIGDELRDIEAAQKSGIESVAVTWGFNTEDLLSKGKPTHVVNQPSELLSLLEVTPV